MVPKPAKEAQSEYDLYNSYGSSIGFSDEKRLSDRVKNRIKASFRYRDEIETADSESFFSKFGNFGMPKELEPRNIVKPNKSLINELNKNASSEGKRNMNFPSINKNTPVIANPFSLPSLKK
mmetsp:Transcript_39758/g.45638  ORF Transcript_39758/g.45638 Transcript_39758/m.45638 type:complete len:122 (+) Transcript_39758:604-969(+)